MKGFNLFYLTLIVLGIGLALLFFKPKTNSVVSFYGFAETNETEINFNHPLMIDQIYTSPGQLVSKGQKLIGYKRIKSKEVLQDQGFRINELNSEYGVWKTEQENKIKILESKEKILTEEFDSEIKELEKELDYKKSLLQGLETIKPELDSYKPLQDKITDLKREKSLKLEASRIQRDNMNMEMLNRAQPLQQKISRLNAEIQFENDNKIISEEITAPADGLIGNIHCKEGEHVPSFTTLISFYEPHPTLVKGFVHEDLILEVNVGDEFKVNSLKDITIAYSGKVIGLGSRIIEIPSRLRKLPDLKTYGREVTISIDANNRLLQKEKVSLELSDKSSELRSEKIPEAKK